MTTKRRAVYAGVFDPLTKGHWSIIESGVRLFDELIVGIGKNPGKNPLFSPEERKDIILKSIAEAMLVAGNMRHMEALSKIKVEIFEDEFLVNFAERNNANYILRGLRDSEDFRQEQAYSFFNKKFAPHIQTVYLMPDAEYSAVSSSAVKAMIGPKGWQEFVKPYLTNSAYSSILNKTLTKEEK